MRLVLASESPYRKELLERLNLSFITSPAHINEEDIWQTGLSPIEVSIELAKERQKKVLEVYPDDVIIGSDQVISLDDFIFGKPKTKEKAIQQLMQLRGKKPSTNNKRLYKERGQGSCFFKYDGIVDSWPS